MYTNAQILAAVLNKWMVPLVNTLVESNLSSIPFVSGMEATVRRTGFVSQAWSLTKEISPLLNNVTSIVVEPILARYIANVPDEAVPMVAHSIVDNAIKTNAPVRLFEGRVVFSTDDIVELKRYLDYNLPLDDRTKAYEVKTQKTTAQ